MYNIVTSANRERRKQSALYFYSDCQPNFSSSVFALERLDFNAHNIFAN